MLLPGTSAAAPSGARFPLNRRVLAFALSAAIHAALLAALLLWHLAPSLPDLGTALTVMDLREEPPVDPPTPPPPPPDPKSGSPHRGDHGAAGKQADPPPFVPNNPFIPPQLPSADNPGTGAELSSGAALAGAGSGAGGIGNGSGGGGSGDGGGSPMPRAAVDPQVIRGSFRQSDYPKELRQQGPKGTTWAEVIVGVNGRVTSCRISRPSGVPQFDAKTCEILLQRFRYRPARDAAGRPVAAPDSFSVDWDYVDLNEEGEP